MAEPGESHSAPGPAASWTRHLAESVSVGLLQGRRGRIAWANAKLAELVGEKTPSELEGRALDTLVMDAGGGLPDWVSSGRGGRRCRVLAAAQGERPAHGGGALPGRRRGPRERAGGRFRT